MSWDANLHPTVEKWLEDLKEEDPRSVELIIAAIDLLCDKGPGLGRTMVDTVKGSNYANMKELRPGSSGSSEMRILFIFDTQRVAQLLVAGDKSGNWSKWYRKNIPVADRRYEEHLDMIKRGKNV